MASFVRAAPPSDPGRVDDFMAHAPWPYAHTLRQRMNAFSAGRATTARSAFARSIITHTSKICYFVIFFLLVSFVDSRFECAFCFDLSLCPVRMHATPRFDKSLRI